MLSKILTVRGTGYISPVLRRYFRADQFIKIRLPLSERLNGKL